MPSKSPSAYPWINAIGVFNSCETLERNSFLISSIWIFCSISFCNSLFADFNSEIVISSLEESWFILFPKIPISSLSWRLYFTSKFKFDIFSEILASSRIGLVNLFVTNTIIIVAKTTTTQPTYPRNWLEIATLSRILSKGVRKSIYAPLDIPPDNSK